MSKKSTATLSDLSDSDKARIGRLAREVLALRRQVASAKAGEPDSTQPVDSPSIDSSHDSEDVRIALREAAASLAAADAAQRRAELRESTAQQTLAAQRELWKQREREYSQVLRAAELTLTTMRKRTADYDELVAELALYRSKYPHIKVQKSSSKDPSPVVSRRPSVTSTSSIGPERHQVPSQAPASSSSEASSTFLRLLPRDLIALADSAQHQPLEYPNTSVSERTNVSRSSSTESTRPVASNPDSKMHSSVPSAIPTLADRLKEILQSESSISLSAPSVTAEPSKPTLAPTSINESTAKPSAAFIKQPIHDSLPLQSATDDSDLDSAIAALKLLCDSDSLDASRQNVSTPLRSVAPTPSRKTSINNVKPLSRPRSVEPKLSKKVADKKNINNSQDTDELLWKLVWSELDK